MNNITSISKNMNSDFKPNVSKRTTFQITPLDVNLAQLQFNLQKRLCMEVPEDGIFCPVVEKYDNEDSRLNVSDLKITCRGSSENKKDRAIIAEVTNRARTLNYSYTLFNGNKKELLEYINSGDNLLFETAKQLVFYVSEQNKRKS